MILSKYYAQIGYELMEIRGSYSISTIDGHKSDECKSAMQKYARRGMADKMYYAVQQLNGLVRYDKPDRRDKLSIIKSIRTNTINRLSVILFEDVSYKDIVVFENVCSLIKLWKTSRSDKIEENDGSSILKEICVYIASAKKARQPSFLRNYYGHRSQKVCKTDFEKMMACNSSFDNSFSWVYQNEYDAVTWLREQRFPDRIVPLVKYSLLEWKRLKKSPRASDRLIFLVVPMLWIKYGWTDYDITPAIFVDIVKLDRFDEFVYDMHTRKGGSKSTFVSEGSIVTNEDVSAVDCRMKQLYLLQLMPLKTISIPVFTNVEMITEGLCGWKLPCFYAVYEREKKVVKPFTSGLNYGLDYAYVDAQKTYFGLVSLHIKLVEIPGYAVVKQKTGQFELITNSDTRQVFAIMDNILHKGDLGKNKYLLNDEAKYDEMLKIRLVDGLFNTSDNILRNILVRNDNVFVSIDENDIMGKREKIFNTTEPIKRSVYWCKDRIIKIINSLSISTWKSKLLDNLSDYGLDHKRDALAARFDNYTEIALNDM